MQTTHTHTHPTHPHTHPNPHPSPTHKHPPEMCLKRGHTHNFEFFFTYNPGTKIAALNVLLQTIQGHHHTPVLFPRLEQYMFTLFSHSEGRSRLRYLQPRTSPVEVFPPLCDKNTCPRKWAITGARTPHPTTPPHTPINWLISIPKITLFQSLVPEIYSSV